MELSLHTQILSTSEQHLKQLWQQLGNGKHSGIHIHLATGQPWSGG